MTNPRLRKHRRGSRRCESHGLGGTLSSGHGCLSTHKLTPAKVTYTRASQQEQEALTRQGRLTKEEKADADMTGPRGTWEEAVEVA